MAAAPLRHDPSDNVEALFARIRELAVLPHVVYKVLEVSGSSDTSTSEVEKAIVVDPGFSSRLLTAVNSAFYALPRKITSIREAVMFLGLKTIRQLAMTVGIYDMFVGKTDKESLRRRAWWRHSVDTAVCSRWIATKVGKMSADDAYTCGLLHYIGKTLLDRFGGRTYDDVEALVAQGWDETKAELEVYGCDHTDIAIDAARRWGFPESLVEGLQYDRPAQKGEPHAPYRACVALGAFIAQIAVSGSSESRLAENESIRWAIDLLGIKEKDYPEILEGGKIAIAQAATLEV